MKFTRLELLGFKSFVDRTVIEFGDLLTAIVGPNGCGKSNVSDAIRWVLGEQGPKNLRAKKMEDVIFNGSADRKPLGMAEVSLTISDIKGVVTAPDYQDYDELVVTRRLYRSGESEYLINRNPCRLKDIVDIFLDTGVSLDTFSIVEQGRIEGLVNAKPLDRRLLIEEAAGIMKYKNRRNEALRKLELAQGNLLRIGDVMREKESRMRSLRRQARKATFHKEYQQEINDLDIRITSLDLLRLESELEPVEKNFIRIQEENERQSAALSAREAERERCRIEVAERSEALAEIRRRAVEVEGYLQRLENRLEMLSSRLTEMDGEDVRRTEEMESLQEETKKLEAERTRLQELERSLSQEVVQFQEQYDRRANELRLLRAELTKWEETESETRNAKTREAEALSRARQRMASGESRQESIRESVERIGRDISEATSARQSVQEELDANTTRLQEASGAVSRAKEASETALSEKSRIENLLREGETAVSGLRETLVESRSSLQAIENLEGEPSLERIGVSEFRSLGVETKGVLRDLLTVDARYEKAIEAALGANLLGVIVPDSESASSAIQKLSASGRGGRGLLLPQNAKTRSAPPIPRMDGVEGGAMDFVRCADSDRPLMAALLTGVGVARDLNAALAAWRAGPEGLVWVTLDGDLIFPSGGIEGGAKSEVQVGLLGRKRRTEELRADAETNQVRLRELEEDLSTRRERLAEAEEKVRSTAERVRETELAFVELESSCKALKEKLSVAEERLKALDEERRQLTEERGRVESEQREFEQEAQRATSALQEAESQGQKAEAEVKRLSESVANLERDVTDRRVELTEAQGKASGAQAELQRVEEAISQNSSRLERRNEEEEDSQRKRERLEENLSQSREEIERLKQEKAEVEKEQAVRSRVVEEARSRDVELADQIRDIRDGLTAVQKNLSEMAERRTTLRVQRETMIESAKEDFEIDLTQTAKANEVYLADYQEHANRLEMIRQRLARMGEVNPLAAQEFDEINQEFSFLSEQQEDLETSIQDLHTTIDKLNQTTRKRFLDAFEEVSEHFKNIFGRLFLGGEARMYLLDPNDPLETGVDIEVRPPGKRPGNIMLLSAGEKALTAIALLFSVFSVRPSPFCLLDEVDATLDDANVGRFREVLEELEDRSQFILITHNKRTMSYASQLYGITQKEKGVSLVVSVKMSRPEEAQDAPEPAAEPVAALDTEEAETAAP